MTARAPQTREGRQLVLVNSTLTNVVLAIEAEALDQGRREARDEAVRRVEALPTLRPVEERDPESKSARHPFRYPPYVRRDAVLQALHDAEGGRAAEHGPTAWDLLPKEQRQAIDAEMDKYEAEIAARRADQHREGEEQR